MVDYLESAGIQLWGRMMRGAVVIELDKVIDVGLPIAFGYVLAGTSQGDTIQIRKVVGDFPWYLGRQGRQRL